MTSSLKVGMPSRDWSKHYRLRLGITQLRSAVPFMCFARSKMAASVECGEKGQVRHLVADSAAFIKNAPLHELCDNVYSIQDVVSEIRDAGTRQRLSVLPYEIIFREPSTEAVRIGESLPEACRSTEH